MVERGPEMLWASATATAPALCREHTGGWPPEHLSHRPFEHHPAGGAGGDGGAGLCAGGGQIVKPSLRTAAMTAPVQSFQVGLRKLPAAADAGQRWCAEVGPQLLEMAWPHISPQDMGLVGDEALLCVLNQPKVLATPPMHGAGSEHVDVALVGPGAGTPAVSAGQDQEKFAQVGSVPHSPMHSAYACPQEGQAALVVFRIISPVILTPGCAGPQQERGVLHSASLAIDETVILMTPPLHHY